jgi:hypothetical protein
VVEVAIQQIRAATTFMLDPDIVLLLTHLSRKGYATAFARLGLGGASITSIIPPNVIAIKGNIRVDYDFGRRSLGIEGLDAREVALAFQDVWEVLKNLGIDIQKALIPCEVIVIAFASLSPKFSSSRVETLDLLGHNLRMVEAGFALEDGDPASPSKWLHIRITPVYSSYKPGEKENLYRIEVVYRDEREKVLRFLENVNEVLRKLLERV